MAAAARFGFKGVECMSPYEETANALGEALGRHDLTMALINAPAGNWLGGDRGLAVLPDREYEYSVAVQQARRYADAIGCKRVNVLAGIAGGDESAASIEARLVDRLRYAADVLAPYEIDLLLEPINPYDFRGFFVNTPAHAVRILDRVARDNAKLQFDVYHAQRTGGELTEFIRTHLDRIGHIQIADNPGRHEPGTGEINYSFLLGELERLGYAGWVGLEYRPSNDTETSFAWLREMGYGP